MVLVVLLGFEPKTYRYERHMFTVYTTEPYWVLKKLVRQIRIERISSGLQPDALPFELPTHNIGGQCGTWTHDLLLAKQTFSLWTNRPFGAECRNLIQHIGVPSGTRTHTVARQFLRLVRLPFRHRHIYLAYPLGLEPRLIVLETIVLIHWH